VGDIEHGQYIKEKTFPKELERLYDNKLLSKEECSFILQNWKQGEPVNLEEIKAVIRKHYVIRWNAKEIEAGKKKINGKTVLLEDIIEKGNNQINIETIIIVDGKIYDMSNFYSLLYDDKKNGQIKSINLNQRVVTDFHNFFLEGLRNSMNNLITSKLDYNPIKYLKRIYSYAKYTKNEPLANRVLPILNGILGNMYQLKSEISTILKLMESGYKYPPITVWKNIEAVKYRLSVSPFFSDEVLKKYNSLIEENKNHPDLMIVVLTNIKQNLVTNININTTQILTKMGLLPIPKELSIHQNEGGSVLLRSLWDFVNNMTNKIGFGINDHPNHQIESGVHNISPQFGSGRKGNGHHKNF
jgi:hypothetical protein